MKFYQQKIIGIVFASVVIALFPCLVFSQTKISIVGSGKLYPIALPQLCEVSGETDAHKEIAEIMARDLDLSGFFEVLNPGVYVETQAKCGAPDSLAYSDWSIVGAEGLVRGQVSYDGKIVKVQLYLHDVPRQRIVLGKEYEGDISQIRLIAHKFTNEIMRFFTGEAGVFGTQIAFSSRVGRFKELYVMDMDGSNIRTLTNDKALSFSSSWDPSGKRIVYTSYRLRQPELFMLSLDPKASTRITKGQPESLPLGARFLKDGQTLILSYSLSGEADIVLMGLDGSIKKKLTKPNGTIDVSPALSPDGAKVAFCSNRAGGPQIYVMNSDGSDVKRVSYVTSNYCTSPAWSPKGNRLAFVCRADSSFNIFTSDVDGSNPLQLTSFGNNEDPDWSPDGRYLTFSSTFGKGFSTSIALMRDDGSNIRQLTSSRIGDSDPAWGPKLD